MIYEIDMANKEHRVIYKSAYDEKERELTDFVFDINFIF